MTTPTTMDAITYTAYGGPEAMAVQSFPVPTPGAGEVLIRVAAGGLNPVDWRQRSGAFKLVTPYTFPVIAGNEVSGHVAGVGAGVTGFGVGDAVIARSPKSDQGGMGGFAAYVAFPASVVSKAPKSVDIVTAAGLPLAGLTAEQAFDLLELKAGDRLLITGGAGGVGQFAIQLAKIRGAHVTTTASAAGRPYVLAAGADAVIDYKTQKIAEVAAADADKFDKVFDTAGGNDALVHDVIPAVKRGAKIVSVGGPLTWGCLDALLPWWKAPLINPVLYLRSRDVTSAAAARGATYQYFFMVPDGAQLQMLADYVDAGKLKINIDARLPFDQYKTAFEKLESGRSKGKIVIEFPK